MCYATFSQYSLAYDQMINDMENTATIDKMYTIFKAQDPSERDASFDVDQLRDIVNYGMSAGVPGFIYTKDNVSWFDDNEDTIEEYLSDWYYDNLGERNYLALIAEGGACQSIDQLKSHMVWTYVELKAHEILCSVDPNY